MAYVQDDAKKLVAYSSVSHLGFVVLGIVTLTEAGVQGALYQMLAHGISTGGLFLGVGLLYDRRHSRKLADFGGLWAKTPVFAACFLVIVLASVGLPGLCGFVGEFLVLLGTFTADKTWALTGVGEYLPGPKVLAILSASAVILSAMYLLTMFQKLMFGPLDKPENKAASFRDIHGRETWVFGIVIVDRAGDGDLAEADPRPFGEVGAGVPDLVQRPAAGVAAQPRRARARLSADRLSADCLSAERRCARRGRPRCAGRRPAMSFNAGQILAYAPMMILIAMGCVILLAETFVISGTRRGGMAWLGVAGCVAALAAVVAQWGDAAQPETHFQGMLVVDRMALFLDGAFIVAGAGDAAVLGAVPARAGLRVRRVLRHGAVRRRRHDHGGARDAHGVAADRHRDDVAGRLRPDRLLAPQPAQLRRGDEVLPDGRVRDRLPGLRDGAGLRHHRRRAVVRRHQLPRSPSASKAPMFFLGEYFILIALAFKVAAVPFHMWAPDAYEGAPTPVTGFMAAGVKTAAFGGILRLLSTAFGSPLLVFDITGWASILSVLAALTMTLGNLAALRQENIKRLLAYSSIAHAGYILIGVIAAGLGVAGAQGAVLFYLVSYTFTTLGAFGVVAWIGSRTDERLFIDDWAGVAAARPAVGAGDDDLLAVARRRAADRRLLREVLSLSRRDGEPAALLAGRARRAQQRRQRLLLPAHRGGDVLPRCAAPAGPHRFDLDARRAVDHGDRRGPAGPFPGSIVDWAGPSGNGGVAVTALAK